MNDKWGIILFLSIPFALGGTVFYVTDTSLFMAWFFWIVAVFFTTLTFWEELGIQQSAASLALPPAIEYVPGLFSGEDVPYIDRDTPAISGKLLDHFSDQSALSSHVAYLNDVHRRASEALKQPPERFNADRRKVEAQQLVLRQMADQAAKIARKVETSFPKLKTDTAVVPRPKPITLPAPPKLNTLANLADRQRNFAMASGRVIAQGGAQGGIMGMAIAAAASAAISVIAFQKQVRAMEEAHGQLDTFLSDAHDDLQVLALAHPELVDVSQEVQKQSSDLKELLIWAEQAAKEGRFAAQTTLNDLEITKIASITTYALTARIDAARTV